MRPVLWLQVSLSLETRSDLKPENKTLHNVKLPVNDQNNDWRKEKLPALTEASECIILMLAEMHLKNTQCVHHSVFNSFNLQNYDIKVKIQTL